MAERGFVVGLRLRRPSQTIFRRRRRPQYATSPEPVSAAGARRLRRRRRSAAVAAAKPAAVAAAAVGAAAAAAAAVGAAAGVAAAAVAAEPPPAPPPPETSGTGGLCAVGTENQNRAYINVFQWTANYAAQGDDGHNRRASGAPTFCCQVRSDARRRRDSITCVLYNSYDASTSSCDSDGSGNPRLGAAVPAAARDAAAVAAASILAHQLCGAWDEQGIPAKIDIADFGITAPSITNAVANCDHLGKR